MHFQLPHLPYGHSELEPFLTSEQLDCHYFGHHKAYVDKVNKAVSEQNLGDKTLEYLIHNQDGKLFDNAAQAWNHTFYWLGLTPKGAPPESGGALLKAINAKFGSLDGLKTKFMDSASGLFGSGWTWLVANPNGELDILNTQNADNPMRLERVRPLWTCDIWEHAYYVDYRNDRKEYLNGAWNHIQWKFVEQNFALEEIPNMTKHMTGPEAATSSQRV